jgi:FkbM family methyltransferase
MTRGFNLIPSILWHPHQGLWNLELMEHVTRLTRNQQEFEKVLTLIVRTDTFIRFFFAILERMATLGPLALYRKAAIPRGTEVLYLDLGTHEQGKELAFTIDRILEPIGGDVQAYGFEANQQTHSRAAARFANRPNVTIIRKALVFEVPPNGQIKLYKDQEKGLGDSLYRQTAETEVVECCRLSEFLNSNQLLKSNQIRLLRMNIEGAEYDVVQDLVEAGLVRAIDGYFGMWDDVYKIDPPRDVKFRRLLREQQIKSIPFNGRDMNWPPRQRLIIYHVQTRIMQAIQRIDKERLAQNTVQPLASPS